MLPPVTRLILFDIDGTPLCAQPTRAAVLVRASKILWVTDALDGARPAGRTDSWIVADVAARRNSDVTSTRLSACAAPTYATFRRAPRAGFAQGCDARRPPLLQRCRHAMTLCRAAYWQF